MSGAQRSRILTFSVAVDADYVWKADEYRGRIEKILRERLGVYLTVTREPESQVVEPTPGEVRSRNAKAARRPPAPRVSPLREGRAAGRAEALRSIANPPRRGKSDWNATIQKLAAGMIDLPGGGVSYLGFDEAAPGGDHSAVVVRQDATGVDDMVFPPIMRKLAPYESHKPTRDPAPEPQSLGDIAARLVAELDQKRKAGKRAMCCHKTVLKGGQCEDCPYHE